MKSSVYSIAKPMSSDKEKIKQKSEQVPLVVDLDGSLLKTDLLYECVAYLLRYKPWLLLLLPFWLLSGKAYLKRRLAEEAKLDFDSLPVNEKLVDWLKAEKEKGRMLALVSASDAHLVNKVAEKFTFFDLVQGSDGITNLAGANKLSLLTKLFGPKFTYVGNSNQDVIIWKNCHTAVLVGYVLKLKERLVKDTIIEAEFSHKGLNLKTWIKVLRLHQWSKNALIFVPFILAGPVLYIHKLIFVMIGFFCFSLLASGTYLVNDLIDLIADRKHRSKRNRPLASGELPILQAFLMIPVIFGIAASLLFFLPVKFIIVSIGYLVIALTYSFILKTKPIMDLVVLASLFSLRLLAGMLVLEIPISPWLLAFSMFFFFSLAAIKRYSECLISPPHSNNNILGRGYRAGDCSLLMSMGTASGFCSSMVFFIYLMEPASLTLQNYVYPKLLWIICVMLNYWLGRAWFIASRNAMHDDPIVFALKDKTSLIFGVLIALIMFVASGILY